jgi:hypothetical protein
VLKTPQAFWGGKEASTRHPAASRTTLPVDTQTSSSTLFAREGRGLERSCGGFAWPLLSMLPPPLLLVFLLRTPLSYEGDSGCGVELAPPFDADADADAATPGLLCCCFWGSGRCDGAGRCGRAGEEGRGEGVGQGGRIGGGEQTGRRRVVFERKEERGSKSC